MPTNTLMVVASDDAYVLGVLSSKHHTSWALETGGRLGKTRRYSVSTCFASFPFPDATPEQREQIGAIAKKIDVHRKERQAEHPKLTMTDIYAVLDDMKFGVHLDAKKERVSQQGDLATLFQLHQELDAAVAEAYGWPVDLPSDELLVKLLELNHERSEQEMNGKTQWLRPEFQTIRHGMETSYLSDAPLNRFQLMIQALGDLSVSVH